MIVLIAEWVDIEDRYGIPTGQKEYLVSHGVCTETGRTIITDQFDPRRSDLCYLNEQLGEWVLK